MGEVFADVPDAVWGALALVASGVLVAWINQRGKKPETTSTFIDDLMARITDVEKRLTSTEAALDAERKARQDDRDDFRRRLAEKDAYNDLLLAHIRDGKGPPPPPYPLPLPPPVEAP